MAPLSIPPGEDLLWMHTARALIGTSEVAGAKHNPLIVQFHRATKLRAKDDETPWCAAFVCHCLEAAGVHSTRSAAARSYLTWGQRLAAPVYGCVAVLSRLGSPVHGHVGFFVGRRDGRIPRVQLLGGNQGNAVSIASYPEERVLSYVWPAQVALPPGAELAGA